MFWNPSCELPLLELRRLFFLGHGLCASLWLLLTYAHVRCGAAGFDHVGSTCLIVRCQLYAFPSVGARFSCKLSRSRFICWRFFWPRRTSLPVLVGPSQPVVPSVVTVPGFPQRDLFQVSQSCSGLDVLAGVAARPWPGGCWSLTKLRYHANAELDTVGCVFGSKQVGYNHCGAAALFLLDSSVVATKGAADSQPNKFKLY